MVNLLIGCILSGWLMAIAIVSVQNATLVSLRFFAWQSVPLPFGVILSFSAAAGVLGGSVLQGFGGQGDRPPSPRSRQPYGDREEIQLEYEEIPDDPGTTVQDASRKDSSGNSSDW